MILANQFFTMKSVIGVFVCVCACISAVKGSSESNLQVRLFENYDKLVRPVRNPTDVIPVKVNIIPVAIKDVDVKDKIVKLQSWLAAKWLDQYLVWDPVEEGGIEELRLPVAAVWKPDLTLYSATSDDNVMPSVMTNVVVYHNGTVLWIPPFDTKTRCEEAQVTTDSFVCTSLVGSWTYDVGLLDIREDVTDVLPYARESFYDTNEKWTLESMTASSETKFYPCCVKGYNVVKHIMTFKRRDVLGN